MKKLQTTYQLIENKRWSIFLTKNEETGDHYSIHDSGEPCSGVLKHWASKEDLIKELQAIIKALSS